MGVYFNKKYLFCLGPGPYQKAKVSPKPPKIGKISPKIPYSA